VLRQGTVPAPTNAELESLRTRLGQIEVELEALRLRAAAVDENFQQLIGVVEKLSERGVADAPAAIPDVTEEASPEPLPFERELLAAMKRA